MANAANEAHLKLLKEQLDRLNPESKAYKKIEAEYARQKKYASGEADHVGPRPRAGGSHGSSRGYSDPFSRGAGSAWAGWDDYVAEGRKDDEFQVKTRLILGLSFLYTLTHSRASYDRKDCSIRS